MNYAARLAKLEKIVGKGMCPYCRLNRRHTWFDATKARPKPKDPDLLVTHQCDLCGTPVSYKLSVYPEDIREIVRLLCTSKLEDAFINPRIWAAQRWLLYWAEARRRRRKARREIQNLSAPPKTYEEQQRRFYEQQKREREQARAKDPDVKHYHKLLAESQALGTLRLRRLERQYGKHPFPDLEARLKAVENPDYRHII